MKKCLSLVPIILFFGFNIYAQANINVTVIVAPVGAAITMNSYVWEISFPNDGTNSYQNDNQGIMTIKSGTSGHYRVDFTSQSSGYIKQGTYQIPYYIKATQITGGDYKIVGTPAIIAGYVQLTNTQSIEFKKKTPKDGIQFYTGIKIDPVSGQFYESGTYTDILTISFTAL